MTFAEYQKWAQETAIYPNKGNNYIYPVLGLTGEAGEVADKVKKIMRDENGIVSEEKRSEIEKELGDVLWYISQTAVEFGIDLESVAQKNLEKLKSRLERNCISGSGDNR